MIEQLSGFVTTSKARTPERSMAVEYFRGSGLLFCLPLVRPARPSRVLATACATLANFLTYWRLPEVELCKQTP